MMLFINKLKSNYWKIFVVQDEQITLGCAVLENNHTAPLRFIHAYSDTQNTYLILDNVNKKVMLPLVVWQRDSVELFSGQQVPTASTGGQ